MSFGDWGKVIASVIVTLVVFITVSGLTDFVYQPKTISKRGYQVDLTQDTSTNQKAAKEQTIGQLMATADANKGKVLANKCLACHTLKEGENNKIGPNLWNIVNREKAKEPGFVYSKAMTDKDGSWDYDDLYHFLKSPRKFAPGTKMGFAGFSKPQDAADVIAYLRTLSNKEADLPQ